MLIQVLGYGLIPRGLGIAPKKEPFEADLETIKLILGHGALICNMINPKTGAKVRLTSANYMKMWNAYNKPVKKTIQPQVVEEAKTEVAPVKEETKEQPKEQPKNQNNNQNNNNQQKNEQKSENNQTYKPVNANDNNNKK